ncbi:MFS transporter [Arthrobacter sp. 49Tsu3.1M3]|uniref:MFS transporter n=1 Tax=Arthrobacter sp. 49Tsu3.1M3 TaxID=1279029 RepID=UPI0021178B01|nr:MFS transporter [Arthrobacter sp. 49Tsu3.1M3]
MNPAPATTARPAAILAIILASYVMILLDNSVIFTALPSLQADLQLSTGELSWVQDAYTLVFGGLLLLGARAGDLLGRRRVFVFGLVVFSVASLLIGLAPAGWWDRRPGDPGYRGGDRRARLAVPAHGELP